MSVEGRMRQHVCISNGKNFLPLSRAKVKTKIGMLSTRAREIKDEPLNNLACFIDRDWLIESWIRLNKKSATGIDKVSAEEYAKDLPKNIDTLLMEMKLGNYKPRPLKRVYIPKANGGRRKLGLPALRDKLAQQSVSMILAEIYEQEFLPMSFGYRPGRTSHDALDGVKEAIAKGKVSWVVDADISSFFDEMSHEWLMKFLRHRIADKHLLRLINKWLKAGVMEEGKIEKVSTGTPQGGVISPVLANIYLHYAIDLWVTKTVSKYLIGEMHSFRYADDILFCFQNFQDARRFKNALEKRLAKFGLSLNQTKSQLCRFGRFAEENRKRAGEKRKTIQFLGFTLYNKISRKGKYTVGCRTASSKLNIAMNNITKWCKENRHQKIAWQARYLNAVLRGHYHYYGVTHNFPSINAFYRHVQKMWQRYLSRRSQRGYIPWDKFYQLLERFPLEKPYLPKAMHW
jgi:RNA-directed DNA polymerase